MKRIMRFIALLFLFVLNVIAFSSCMVTRPVTPDGFAEFIESSDAFPAEIQTIRYIPSMNTISIGLTLKPDHAIREDVAQVVNVITAYLNTNQFGTFMEYIQEFDDGFFFG